VVTHEVFSALSCENDPTSVELRSFEDEIGLYEERVVKESWKLMKLSKSLSTGFKRHVTSRKRRRNRKIWILAVLRN